MLMSGDRSFTAGQPAEPAEKCTYPFTKVFHPEALEKMLTNHDYCAFRSYMAVNHPAYQRVHSEEGSTESGSALTGVMAMKLARAYLLLFGANIGIAKVKNSTKNEWKIQEYLEIRELCFLFLSNIPPSGSVIDLPPAVAKVVHPIATDVPPTAAISAPIQPRLAPTLSGGTPGVPVGVPGAPGGDIMSRLALLLGESAVLGHSSGSSFQKQAPQPARPAAGSAAAVFGSKPINRIKF